MKKKKKTVPVPVPQNESYEYEEDESEFENEENEAEHEYEIEGEQEIHGVDESFETTIGRMKSIINGFRKSPVRNGLLQAELKKQNLPMLQLTSFTKTRWNSLVISGKRFLLLLPAVRVTLLELGSKLVWEDVNTKELEVGA